MSIRKVAIEWGYAVRDGRGGPRGWKSGGNSGADNPT
jgi:hypothetical protein